MIAAAALVETGATVEAAEGKRERGEAWKNSSSSRSSRSSDREKKCSHATSITPNGRQAWREQAGLVKAGRVSRCFITTTPRPVEQQQQQHQQQLQQLLLPQALRKLRQGRALDAVPLLLLLPAVERTAGWARPTAVPLVSGQDRRQAFRRICGGLLLPLLLLLLLLLLRVPLVRTPRKTRTELGSNGKGLNKPTTECSGVCKSGRLRGADLLHGTLAPLGCCIQEYYTATSVQTNWRIFSRWRFAGTMHEEGRVAAASCYLRDILRFFGVEGVQVGVVSGFVQLYKMVFANPS